jgi:phosphomannomutase
LNWGILFSSDIRGVAVAGVEGEPVNLTEPVTEAIAAAFASWLLNKKKTDGLRRLRISVGHDSRISANKLQVACIIPLFVFLSSIYLNQLLIYVTTSLHV